jgi:hypothetical protein
MEAFEHFVAVALGAQGFVVSSGVKFPVRRRTKKKKHAEVQTHGYEVDLVAARADRLVLATVKSYFGSKGVKASHVRGEGKSAGLYRLLNDREIREQVLAGAAERYGYARPQIELRLYVGRFAGKNGREEPAVRAWCESQLVGAGPIRVMSLPDVVNTVRSVAISNTYVNDPVVVTMKVLAAAGLVDLEARVEHIDPGSTFPADMNEHAE